MAVIPSHPRVCSPLPRVFTSFLHEVESISPPLESGLGHVTCSGQRSIKKCDALGFVHRACPLLPSHGEAQIGLSEGEKTWGARKRGPEEAPTPTVLPTTGHVMKSPFLSLFRVGPLPLPFHRPSHYQCPPPAWCTCYNRRPYMNKPPMVHS